MSQDFTYVTIKKQKYQITQKPLQVLLCPVGTCLYILNTILFKKKITCFKIVSIHPNVSLDCATPSDL